MLVIENREEVNTRLDVWRLALEEKWLRINRSKTKYIEYEFDEREKLDETSSGMTVDGDKVK